MNNTEIFLEFWKTYQWPDVKPIVYRLYYDEQGYPVEYSMEDRQGLYIDVTPEEFRLANMRVRVQDGQITYPPPPAPPRLAPSTQGTPCHPGDITVIVKETEPHQRWSLKRNEAS